MRARFQLYQSVIVFTMMLRDIGHFFRVNEIIDPNDPSRIKGWEVCHELPSSQRILWTHDPAKALSEEEAATLRRKWDEHFMVVPPTINFGIDQVAKDLEAARDEICKAFAVSSELIDADPMRPSKGFSYTIPFPPGRDA